MQEEIFITNIVEKHLEFLYNTKVIHEYKDGCGDFKSIRKVSEMFVEQLLESYSIPKLTQSGTYLVSFYKFVHESYIPTIDYKHWLNKMNLQASTTEEMMEHFQKTTQICSKKTYADPDYFGCTVTSEDVTIETKNI